MPGRQYALAPAAAADPACPVGDLPWLSAGERQQLLEWNDTAAAWPSRQSCLHQLVEAQALRSPGRVALVVEETGERLTYRRVNARAHPPARRARGLGVRPGAGGGGWLEGSGEHNAAHPP